MNAFFREESPQRKLKTVSERDLQLVGRDPGGLEEQDVLLVELHHRLQVVIPQRRRDALLNNLQLLSQLRGHNTF